MMLDKRLKIVTAAETLFDKKGFKSTSMQEIAIEAGISKGAVYLHFKSKDELLLAVCESHTNYISSKVKEILNDNSLAPLEKLATQIRFQFETDGKSSNDTDFLGRIKYLRSKGDKFSFQEQLDGTYLGIGTLTKSGVTITVDSEAYEDIFTGSWKPVVTSLWDKQATDEGTGDSTNE